MNLYNATMHYVEILVADQSYHGNEALTYQSEALLQIGSLAFVPLRNKEVLGIVVKNNVAKPTFSTKSVLRTVAAPALPEQLVALMTWMRQYYPAPLGIIVQQFLPKSLPKRDTKPFGTKTHTSNDLPPLTDDQLNAVQAISPSGLSLLHGSTGTGKHVSISNSHARPLQKVNRQLY